MRNLKEYHIISGRAYETRRTRMRDRGNGDRPKLRAPRQAGNSSEKKILANEQESLKQLARVLNCNFDRGDTFLTLKYDNEHVPVSYEEAERILKKFLDKLRYQFKKAYQRTPKVVWVTSNWSPTKGRPARPHHHIAMEKKALSFARELWQGGGFYDERIDSRGDHTALAQYMIGNVRDRPAKKKWHCTRNMERPVYTEPVPVDDPEGIQPPKGSLVKDVQTTYDEDRNAIGSYMRCVLKERPKIKGNRIIMPKAERRIRE